MTTTTTGSELHPEDFREFFIACWGEEKPPFAWQTELAKRVLGDGRYSEMAEQLHELGHKHGADFEKWWKEHFGHAFDYLTQSEARHLARAPDVDTIRSRLAEAVRQGGGPNRARSPREQTRHIRDLTARLTERFPDGRTTSPRRPPLGKWQGNGRPQKPQHQGERQP